MCLLIICLIAGVDLGSYSAPVRQALAPEGRGTLEKSSVILVNCVAESGFLLTSLICGRMVLKNACDNLCAKILHYWQIFTDKKTLEEMEVVSVFSDTVICIE